MRLSTFIIGIQLSFISMLMAHETKAQVSLEVQQASIKTIFSQIEKQAAVTFTYNESTIKEVGLVSLNVKNKPLAEVLSLLQQKTTLQFQQIGKLIAVSKSVIKKKAVVQEKNAPPNLLLIPVTGKLTDQKGIPLPGVTVRLKSSNTTTITDKEGNYNLTVPDQSTIVFSFVGFVTQEVVVNGRQEINIILIESLSQLDQIQVIGYGTTTKRLNTGNVSTIKADVIAEQPVTNPLQALAGRVAGLQITQTTGLPGTAVNVSIRGKNSIAANNNPLYIIDGVPFTSTAVEKLTGGVNNVGAGSPLNTINPTDIESIEILKDADATAIYGSRAANGVILITTKKGKSGKSKVDVSVNSGASTLTRIAQTLNTQQYLQMRNDALANSGLTPTAANAPDLLVWNPNAYTNWQKWYMGNSSRTTDVTGSISSGNAQTTFLLSGGYHDESTVVTGDNGYKRGNVHMNIGYASLDKKLHLDVNVFFTSDQNEQRLGSNGTLSSVARSVPNYPTYDNNGNLNWTGGQTNYVAQLLAYTKDQTDNLNGNVNLLYNILPGLDLKSSLGYNKIEANQIYVNPSTSYNPSPQTLGNSIFANQYIKTYLFEPQITYVKKLSKGTLNALIGATLQQNSTVGKQVNAGGYSNDLLLESLSYGTVTYNPSNTSLYKYSSLFGRVTYNWNDKYVFNGTFRRDGSSRFGPGKQFGDFGSVGAAWLFANEKLIEDNFAWLSYGKIRGSFGTTGSDGIGDYGYLSLYNSTLTYGGTNTIIPSQIANSNYQWEVNKKLELAVNLGFLKDRILFNAAWYQNRSSNQLVTYPLPTITGFSGYVANLPALVQNTGWEFEMNTVNFEKNAFKWTSSVNITIPRNKLLSFPGLSATSYANTLIIGQPLNVIQKLHFIGVDPQTGLAQIEDVNKDGNYTLKSSYNNQGGDQVIAGTTDPKWYGGLSNTFNYGDFQLDVFFQYTKQEGYNLQSNSMGTLFNTWTDLLEYWKQPGDVVPIPKPFASSVASRVNYNNSDAVISDASFLRLKNVAFSYTLPQKLVQKFKVSRLKIYLQGQNIWTVTKFMGYDPELAGNASLNVPPLKTLIAGLQCTF